MFCISFTVITWIVVSLALLCNWLGRKDQHSPIKETAAVLTTLSGIALVGGDVFWGSWNYIEFYGGSDHILACTVSIERCAAQREWMWQIDQLWFGPQVALVILLGIYSAVWGPKPNSEA